jgi:uncharacterized membrane protein
LIEKNLLKIYTIPIMAFDFSECLDNISNGRSKTILGNVIYTSIVLALVAIAIMFWIFYSSMSGDFGLYFKAFFYLLIAFITILSLHYSSVQNVMNDKYKNKSIDDIVSAHSDIPGEFFSDAGSPPPVVGHGEMQNFNVFPGE